MKKLIDWLYLGAMILIVLLVSIASPFDDGNPKFYDPYE